MNRSKINDFATNSVITIFLLGIAWVITTYINNQWTGLLIIIFVLLKFGLIDKDIKLSLNNLKEIWDGRYNISEQESSKEENNIINKQKIKNSFGTIKEDYNKIVFWFRFNTNINFNTGRKLIFNKTRVVYPDGIIQGRDIDEILEIKHISSDINGLLSNCQDKFKMYEQYYSEVDKKFNFYFAYVVKNSNIIDNFITKFQSHFGKNKNVFIYIFSIEGDDINLLYK